MQGWDAGLPGATVEQIPQPRDGERPRSPSHSASRCASRWRDRARGYRSSAMAVLRPNGGARSRPPLPTTLTTSYSKSRSPRRIPSSSERRGPASTRTIGTAVSRRASKSLPAQTANKLPELRLAKDWDGPVGNGGRLHLRHRTRDVLFLLEPAVEGMQAAVAVCAVDGFHRPRRSAIQVLESSAAGLIKRTLGGGREVGAEAGQRPPGRVSTVAATSLPAAGYRSNDGRGRLPSGRRLATPLCTSGRICRPSAGCPRRRCIAGRRVGV